MAQWTDEIEIPATPVPLDTVTAARPARAARRWRRLLGALCPLYIVAWTASGAFHIGTTDLEAFFLPSARYVLAGQPWLAYAVRYASYYPNANGPLSLLPLTLAAAIAQHFGVLNDPDPRRAIVMTVFAVFPLLVSYEAVRAIDRLRGISLVGLPRLGAYALFALTPQLWHSMLFYGHVEQPLEIWLALLGIRLLAERRAAWAGLSLGLMLLTRSSSLVILLPLLVVLLCRQRWRLALVTGGTTALVTTLGILPFWLGDRADTVYSLVSFRSQLPIGGGNLWGITLGSPVDAFALVHDSQVVLAAATLIALAACLVRRTLDIDSRELYAMLGVTSFCFPLLIKTMWPYYFLEPYVFVALWWVTMFPRSEAWVRPRWRWIAGVMLPAAIVFVGLVGAIGAGQIETTSFIHAWSLALSLAMLAVMAVVFAAGVVWARPLASRATAPTDADALALGYTASSGG